MRGTFDLERPKKRLIKPQAVGVERAWLHQESATLSQSTASGRNWSRGSAMTNSTATTKNVSLTKGRSYVDSQSRTTAWANAYSVSQSTASVDMTSEGESASSGMTTIPGSCSLEDALTLSGGAQTASFSDTFGMSTAHTTGTVSTQGSSSSSMVGGGHSTGTADGRSTATTRGRATTKGTATSSSVGEGGSTSQATGRSTATGRGEAFAPLYRDLPTEVWSLDEQIHTRSVSLAHVPQGQAWIRCGSERPRRIVIPYVGDQFVLPERVERVRRELLEKTPYVAPARVVDQEYLAYRARLIEAAAPREPDDDIERVIAPADASDPPETIPIPKLLEWK